MDAAFDYLDLAFENERYRGAGGRSEENRPCGFRPAFLDTRTQRVYESRFADGLPAPVHLLDGLPAELVITRNAAGRVTAVRPTVIAGFVRAGRFYTREEASRALSE
ncbi:MAG TPA: hypothetical protein VFR86_05440 [Burkholderiaceae bacterium]|nr:hypothetical protein [Burkholderiaceae bacterium]